MSAPAAPADWGLHYFVLHFNDERPPGRWVLMSQSRCWVSGWAGGVTVLKGIKPYKEVGRELG